jgi:hypothetical protein
LRVTGEEPRKGRILWRNAGKVIHMKSGYPEKNRGKEEDWGGMPGRSYTLI